MRKIFLAKIILRLYLIFVIFFTQAKFLENKIYTEKRQFFANFCQFTPKFALKNANFRQFFALNL